MKTIGLIGGMSWESTVTYYKLINEEIKERLGGLHSAKIIMYSVDFAEIEELQASGDWDKSGEILGKAAQSLEKAGADFILICTNTMHKVVPQIKKYITIPLLHIATATCERLKKEGVKKVGLLGTKYTLTQGFYKSVIEDGGVEVVTPENEDIETVNSIIYDELCLGIIKDSSRKKFKRIIESLAKKGACGVILGCTEIGLLVTEECSSIPIFDTTVIHAEFAAKKAIEN